MRVAAGQTVLILVASGIEAATAALVLGPPDPALAIQFLGSASPTVVSVLAGLRILIWGAVLLTVVLGLLTAMGTVQRTAQRLQRSRAWSGAVLASGLLVLALGWSHHQADLRLSMSGGSVPEARSELGR